MKLEAIVASIKYGKKKKKKKNHWMDPYPCRLVTDLFVISSDRFERERKKRKKIEERQK